MNVANIRNLPANWQANNRYLYIGRANKHHGLPDSLWANPFKLENKTIAHREFVIARFTEHLLADSESLAQLPQLKDKTLCCWCAPQLCHGHVLSVLANLSDDHIIAPPVGGKPRSLSDTAGLITAAVNHIRETDNVCPTDTEYQTALKAEETAKALLQGHKTKQHKDDYEHAKDRRVQIGGAIIGTESIVRRMSAMIAGELQAMADSTGRLAA